MTAYSTIIKPKINFIDIISYSVGKTLIKFVIYIFFKNRLVSHEIIKKNIMVWLVKKYFNHTKIDILSI